MSSNAQRDLYEDFDELPLAATGTDGGMALRRIAAERLAAHRNRRTSGQTVQTAAQAEPRISETAQRVRDAVAARYRRSPTYQDILSTPPPTEPEPQRSVQPQPPVQAPSQTPIQTWIDEPLVPVEPVARMQPLIEEPIAVAAPTFEEPADTFFTEPEPPSLPINTADNGFNSFEIRPYSDLPTPTWLPERTHQSVAPTHPDELQSLDDEIAFRLAPEFEDHLIEPLPIQANIIEVPRQLVAARKARPRLAEGPLRSDPAPSEPEPSLFDPAPPEAAPAGEFQMRIFEVDTREADWVTPAPAPEPPAPPIVEHQAPEWQNLVLDAAPQHHEPHDYLRTRHSEPAQQTRSTEPELSAPPVARFELRLMSALVDAACIGMSFVVFATVTALMTNHALDGVSLATLVASGLALLLVLTVLYQGMFFTLGASTPGMYYAHLEFRTLTGRQPSRGLLRRRITANLIAAAPAGFGLLSSLVDGRSLGWNDRLSGLFLQEL
jgi:hypothetical protein